jgi:palmitoyltransferase
MTALQVYGAYLSWWILRPNFHFNPQNSFLSPAFRQEVGDNFVIAINIGGISVAGVGLLAAATASLPFGLFAYHCYLIWAGMTTNESQKWTEWKDDVADGFVFKGNRKELRDHHRARRTDGSRATVNPALAALLEEDEVHVPWPISNDEVLVRTRDGNAPRGQEALWKPVRSLNDIVNVYDLGTLNNLKEEIHGR